MIGYLEGKLLQKKEDRILVLASQVGYEVLLPAYVMESFASKSIGDNVSLYTYHQQTERQPKPVLIGFNLEVEKEFFQHFITVEDIGPLKAVKALDLPVRQIARAIETEDISGLTRLKGIGRRTAQKIVATLGGKMAKFALIREGELESPPTVPDIAKQVERVLVDQLGYRAGEARKMIAEAMKRNSAVATPEELFEEVYHGQKVS